MRVLKRITDSFLDFNGLPIHINMSLGMAIRNSLDQNIRDVIREAEEKMYRNKLLESLSTRSSFIKSLEKTLWERSHETKEHCQRMQCMARIIAITDAYDVMLNGRPYKDALSKKDALAEIVRCSGTQFDPYLVSKLHFVD